MSRCFLCNEVIYASHWCPQVEAYRKGKAVALKELQPLIESAKAYDAAISAMEREYGRPDGYLTQHTTLKPLREEARKL